MNSLFGPGLVLMSRFSSTSLTLVSDLNLTANFSPLSYLLKSIPRTAGVLRDMEPTILVPWHPYLPPQTKGITLRAGQEEVSQIPFSKKPLLKSPPIYRLPQTSPSTIICLLYWPPKVNLYLGAEPFLMDLRFPLPPTQAMVTGSLVGPAANLVTTPVISSPSRSKQIRTGGEL